MNYRDVHGIMPKNYAWKYPSHASSKYEKDGRMNDDYFKWDFKQSYRDSIYFVRRIHNETPQNFQSFHNYKHTEEELKQIADSHPNWKGKLYNNSSYHTFLRTL